MFKKLALIVAITFSMIVISFSLVMATENMAKVYDKVINKENQYIKVSAKLPIIETQNKAIGEKLTTEIKNKFENTLLDVTDLAQMAKEKDDTLKFTGKYELNSIYDVTYNKNKVLGLYTINYQFTGGAHGMTTIYPYNINIDSGEILKLSHLFKKDFNYKDFINKKVELKINEKPDYYFQDEENKFKSISDNQDFYINDKGIIIIFQLYEIAPYSSGIQEVFIPKEEISDKLIQKIW